MSEFDWLERELTVLGRDLATPEPAAELPERVLGRILAPPPKPTSWWRRRRALGGLAIAAAASVLLIPPVRAAVFEVFHIGAVTVQQSPTSATSPTPSTSGLSTATSSPAGPAAGREVVADLATATARVGIEARLPTALGPPRQIAVTRAGLVIEVRWGSGAQERLLEVFAGGPDWGYLKSTAAAVTWTEVGAHSALWLGARHDLAWIDADGTARRSAPRLAGPTLVWTVPGTAGEITYRLEGAESMAAARRVASSSLP